MSGFPLSFLSDRFIKIDSDNGNLNNLNEANTKALMDLLSGLSNGETILGKVLSSSNDSFSFLALDSNVTVNAKAENGVVLDTGSVVMFEVNKLSDSRISLRPLNVNVNTNVTAESALKAAGIPVDDRTLEMAVRNMEFANPIDIASLSESYKDINAFPQTPVKYIVDLQTMGIPVTEENLEQYESYLNMENSLTGDFIEVSDGMIKSFIPDFPEATVDTKEAYEAGLKTLEEGLKSFDEFVKNLPDEEPLSNLKASFENLSRELQSKIPKGDSREDLINNLKNLISRAGSKDSLGSSVKAETDFAGKLSSLYKDIHETFKGGLEKALINEWTLSVSDVSKKTEIKDLYRKLLQETGDLSKALENVLPKDNPASSVLSSISNNIDFMNALNNFIPFVQIPFRGENGANSAELYVFRNKHSKGTEGEEVSAFLHLDTVNLGPADVYVKMKDNNVSTHFTLSSEENLLFVEDHLDILTKRLSDKGYNLSTKTTVSDGKKAPIEEALDNNLVKVMVSKTSFDARV